WVTGQDAGECGERRAETVTRLDAAQEEQPRALGEGVRGGPPVGPEELQVHSVRDDLPVGPEVARVRVHHGLAHRDRRGVSVEDPLERTPEHATGARARKPRMKRGYHGDADPPGGDRRRAPARRV